MFHGMGSFSAGQDRNGNNATATSGTLDRNLVTTYNDPSGYTTYTTYDSAGNPLVYRVDYLTVTIKSDICSATGGVYNCTDDPQPQNFPTKITLPTGKTYVFKYAVNTPGDLIEMDLPTGAVITYQYKDFYQQKYVHWQEPTYAGSRAVTKRTVTLNGQSNSWTYTPSLGGDTVTDPLGNYQVHTFNYVNTMDGWVAVISPNVYEVSVAYHNAQGQLLRTTNNTYTAEYDPVNNTTANVRSIQTQTILETGQTSEEQTDYETFSYP